MKEYFKYNPLLFLPVVAYTLLHLHQFLISSFFNFWFLASFLVSVALTDLLFFRILKNGSVLTKYMLNGIYTLFIVILFGLNLILVSQNIINELFDNQFIRGRIILPIIFIILIGLQLIFIKNTKCHYFQNIFWSIFCLVIVSSNVLNNNFKNKSESYIIKSYKSLDFIGRKNDNPVVLLILDEYSSPNQLKGTINQNSQFLVFSNQLRSYGWIIKESFESSETSTVHSLASLFNYNLSKTDQLSSMTVFQLAERYFIKKPALMHDLNSRGIKVRNFGIFNLGKLPPLTRLYFYPINFLQLFFSFSSLQNIWDNTGGLKIAGLKTSYYPMEFHNKTLLNILPNALNQVYARGTFTYAHLYMPHSPISYRPAIFRERVDLKNYIDYWHFTNTKILELISRIKNKDQIRIIITGDHGFRGDKRINPHDTFAAFWGFEKEDVYKIKTVQDLGSLINSYY